MWFVVSAGKGKEKAAKEFLLEKVEGVKEVYITPYRKFRRINSHGQPVEAVAPLLKNFVFVNIKVDRPLGASFLGLRTSVGEKTMVFRQLAQSLSKGGYFTYSVLAFDRDKGTKVMKRMKSDYHLLCANPADTPINQIIEQSWVSDTAMNAFMVYNSQSFSSANQLRIEPVAYKNLVKEHDVVKILRGQFAGKEGIVKRCHDGKKDRRFFIEFNSNLCLSISGIHQNDIVIVREAVNGKNAKVVSLWRDIDAVIGALQFGGHPDDAPKELRDLLMLYGQKRRGGLTRLSDTDRLKAAKQLERTSASYKREAMSLVDEKVRNIFRVLGEFFGSETEMNDGMLEEYIPDAPMRPFLTPAAGTEVDDKGYVVLHHKGFDEYVVKTDLSEFFNSGTYDKEKYSPVFDEDYQYYAHVAVVNDHGTRKAIVPWGGFYDSFAILSTPQRKDLAQTLLKRKYNRTFSLFNMKQYLGETDNGEIEGEDSPEEMAKPSPVFEKVNGIGGFTMVIGEESSAENEENLSLGEKSYAENEAHLSLGENPDLVAIQKLIDAVVPAAVEIWQGTRLQNWRQLLQRYVLLHKVPIVDQPSVIADDEKLHSLFQTKDADGKPDLNAIAAALCYYEQSIRDTYDTGNHYAAASLFLRLAKYSAASFVENDMYNFLTPSSPLKNGGSNSCAIAAQADNEEDNCAEVSSLATRGQSNCADSSVYFPDALCAKLYRDLFSAVSDTCLQKYLNRGYAELSSTDSWNYFRLPSFLKKALQATKKSD